MELTETALKEFEQLWREGHPNKVLPRERLVEIASRVLRAVELVYRPIPKNKAEVFERLKGRHQ